MLVVALALTLAAADGGTSAPLSEADLQTLLQNRRRVLAVVSQTAEQLNAQRDKAGEAWKPPAKEEVQKKMMGAMKALKPDAGGKGALATRVVTQFERLRALERAPKPTDGGTAVSAELAALRGELAPHLPLLQKYEEELLAFVPAFLAQNARLGHGLSPAVKGKLRELSLSAERAPVLGDRLRLALPPDAAREPAGPGENESTTLLVAAGEEHLYIVAHDLHALAPKDFLKIARLEVARWGERDRGYAVDASLPLEGSNLRAASVVAKGEVFSTGRRFVYGALIALPDGTVQYIEALLNAAAAEDFQGAQGLAKKIIASVHLGERKVDFTAGKRLLAAKGAKLSMELPNLSMTELVDSGPGYSMHRVHVLQPLGSPRSTLGLYVGPGPSARVDLKDPSVSSVHGKLFGQEVSWLKKLHRAPGVSPSWVQEVILPLPGKADPKVQVFLLAGNPQDLSALQTMAETLAVDAG